nr:hypothetical protein [Tanacetum cinerariifolium]
ARLAAYGAVVRPSIVGPAAGGRRWWGGREARPAAYSQAAEEGGGSEASRWGGDRRVRVVGPRTSPVGPTGEEAVGMRAVVGRPVVGRSMVVGPGRGRDGPAGTPPWCQHHGRGRQGGEADAWAGDEAGGGADNWQPAVVGRQGGEADRLGRGWRGGGGRRVRVVGPRTRPVGPTKRHRRGGRAGRGKGVGGSAEGEAGPARGRWVGMGAAWGGRPWRWEWSFVRGGRGGHEGIGRGGSSPWRLAVVAGIAHGDRSGRSCLGGRPRVLLWAVRVVVVA